MNAHRSRSRLARRSVIGLLTCAALIAPTVEVPGPYSNPFANGFNIVPVANAQTTTLEGAPKAESDSTWYPSDSWPSSERPAWRIVSDLTYFLGKNQGETAYITKNGDKALPVVKVDYRHNKVTRKARYLEVNSATDYKQYEPGPFFDPEFMFENMPLSDGARDGITGAPQGQNSPVYQGIEFIKASEAKARGFSVDSDGAVTWDRSKATVLPKGKVALGVQIKQATADPRVVPIVFDFGDTENVAPLPFYKDDSVVTDVATLPRSGFLTVGDTVFDGNDGRPLISANEIRIEPKWGTKNDDTNLYSSSELKSNFSTNYALPTINFNESSEEATKIQGKSVSYAELSAKLKARGFTIDSDGVIAWKNTPNGLPLSENELGRVLKLVTDSTTTGLSYMDINGREVDWRRNPPVFRDDNTTVPKVDELKVLGTETTTDALRFEFGLETYADMTTISSVTGSTLTVRQPGTSEKPVVKYEGFDTTKTSDWLLKKNANNNVTAFAAESVPNGWSLANTPEAVGPGQFHVNSATGQVTAQLPNVNVSSSETFPLKATFADGSVKSFEVIFSTKNQDQATLAKLSYSDKGGDYLNTATITPAYGSGAPDLLPKFSVYAPANYNKATSAENLPAGSYFLSDKGELSVNPRYEDLEKGLEFEVTATFKDGSTAVAKPVLTVEGDKLTWGAPYQEVAGGDVTIPLNSGTLPEDIEIQIIDESGEEEVTPQDIESSFDGEYLTIKAPELEPGTSIIIRVLDGNSEKIVDVPFTMPKPDPKWDPSKFETDPATGSILIPKASDAVSLPSPDEVTIKATNGGIPVSTSLGTVSLTEDGKLKISKEAYEPDKEFIAEIWTKGDPEKGIEPRLVDTIKYKFPKIVAEVSTANLRINEDAEAGEYVLDPEITDKINELVPPEFTLKAVDKDGNDIPGIVITRLADGTILIDAPGLNPGDKFWIQVVDRKDDYYVDVEVIIPDPKVYTWGRVHRNDNSSFIIDRNEDSEIILDNYNVRVTNAEGYELSGVEFDANGNIIVRDNTVKPGDNVQVIISNMDRTHTLNPFWVLVPNAIEEPPAPEPPVEEGSSTGEIIGLVVGILALLGILGGGAYWFSQQQR